MSAVIYDPLEEFDSKYKNLHVENLNAFFDELVTRSGVDIEQNRATVRMYIHYTENSVKIQRKLNWLRFLRVIMILTILLIPIVIWKITPIIRNLRADVKQSQDKANALFAEATEQMRPLNALFTADDALNLIEKTIPMIKFEPLFLAKQEENMRINYDFEALNKENQSTLDVLSGHYNENPFLFENRFVRTMGTQVYHGYKTISWTESYTDSQGRRCTRTRTQTLHATVTKPKPYYGTQVLLHYCAQGGPDLTFTRDATHLEQKNEKEIKRYVKRGEKKLKKKTDHAIRDNSNFMSMSNTEFEVLFDAIDRNDEVQFRTLFTPLAQTNMVSLILSKHGYGDDFHFIKSKRTNTIITNHSQGRTLNLVPGNYVSHSFDEIKRNFLQKNELFFKSVYFDFAPLWAIPMYQERPVHSLKPLPDYTRLFSYKECESLANCVDRSYVVHPNSKTPAILKTSLVQCDQDKEETCITAYSYDIIPQIDFVSVYGGDGHFHLVPVQWDDYIPLEAENYFYISEESHVQNQNVIARQNGLCIYSIN